MSMNENLLLSSARRIPRRLRRTILDEGLIEKANHLLETRGTPMEYIFQLYEDFLDPNGEHDDWNCTMCRQFVLNEWMKLKPYLQQLQDEDINLLEVKEWVDPK